MKNLHLMMPAPRLVAGLALATALFIGLDLSLSALQRGLVTPDAAQALGHGSSHEAELAQQAKAIAREAAAREANLAPAARADAFMAGHQVGVASVWLALAMVPPGFDAVKARAPAQAMAIANEGGMASRLGIPALQPLPSRTLGDFERLRERAEADENGQLTVLRQATSRRHAHLFMLGLHAGMHGYARAVRPVDPGPPPAAWIERHAVLAGVAPELWRPLATEPVGATPEARRDAYRAAVGRVHDALATGR